MKTFFVYDGKINNDDGNLLSEGYHMMSIVVGLGMKKKQQSNNLNLSIILNYYCILCCFF